MQGMPAKKRFVKNVHEKLRVVIPAIKRKIHITQINIHKDKIKALTIMKPLYYNDSIGNDGEKYHKLSFPVSRR